MAAASRRMKPDAPSDVDGAGKCYRGLGMTEDKSGFYQDRADELRTVAAQLRFSETRGQLLGIARLFDKLAARIRVREESREAAD